MCLHVVESGRPFERVCASWDPEEQTILVSETAPADAVIVEIRAILADFGTPRPAGPITCHCGDPVALPPRLAAAITPEVRLGA
jgi:hypothetical protein